MNRRDLIIGSGGLPLAPAALAAKPRRMKPQPGDVLVHAFGDRAGSAIIAPDVAAEPVHAFPMDSAGVVRDGSLHNQLALVRIATESLSEKAARYAVAADGASFIAYSAACTHTGCEVNGWQTEHRRLVCPCHGSEFDVADAAKVINGPAPKPLAMLQIELMHGAFRVAGGFSRRVGPAPP